MKKVMNDRLAIIPEKAGEYIPGSKLVAADKYKEPPISGIVVDLPEDYQGNLKIGNKVYYPNYSPIELSLENYIKPEYTTYHFIKPKEVFVVDTNIYKV